MNQSGFVRTGAGESSFMKWSLRVIALLMLVTFFALAIVFSEDGAAGRGEGAFDSVPINIVKSTTMTVGDEFANDKTVMSLRTERICVLEADGTLWRRPGYSWEKIVRVMMESLRRTSGTDPAGGFTVYNQVEVKK